MAKYYVTKNTTNDNYSCKRFYENRHNEEMPFVKNSIYSFEASSFGEAMDKLKLFTLSQKDKQ